MQPTHRAYQASDRGACIALFETNVPHFFCEGEQQDFTEFLDVAASRYLVVLDGGALLACGGFTLSRDAQVASLCWGMVRRDHQRQGLGALLLRLRLQAIALSTSVRSVRLTTSQHSQGFFERHGFEVQFLRPDGFAPGLDEVEMKLEATGISQQCRTSLKDHAKAGSAALGSPS